MKIKTAILSAISILSLAGIVNAAPVQYIFTGTEAAEQYQDYSTVPLSKQVFGSGAPVSLSFFYDASTPASATNFPASTVGAFHTYGNMSEYDGAATQFVGSALNGKYHFSGSTSKILVSNANPGDPVYDRDGIFIESGTPDLNFPAIAGSQFQGFNTSKNFTLTGVNVFETGNSSFFSSQSLPSSLINKNAVTTGLYLTFVDSNNTQQWVEFFGTMTVAPVPLLSTTWLFGSALLSIVGLTRKRT